MPDPDPLFRSMYSSLWMRDDPIERKFLEACGFSLKNCPTLDMRADGLTKPYDSAAKWNYAIWMLGMRYGPDDPKPPPPPSGKSATIHGGPCD